MKTAPPVRGLRGRLVRLLLVAFAFIAIALGYYVYRVGGDIDGLIVRRHQQQKHAVDDEGQAQGTSNDDADAAENDNNDEVRRVEEPPVRGVEESESSRHSNQEEHAVEANAATVVEAVEVAEAGTSSSAKAVFFW